MDVAAGPGVLESAALLSALGFDEREIASRKEFLEFGDEDAARLRELRGLTDVYSDSLTEDLYRHLFAFADARPIFQDPQLLEGLKIRQKEHFRQLTNGDYGQEYAATRIAGGTTLAAIKLPLKLYVGMKAFYLLALMRHVLAESHTSPEEQLETVLSLVKVIFLDLGLSIDVTVAQGEQTIRTQQEAIRELSTPVLEPREGLLLLPVIGLIDSDRARRLSETLLEAIAARHAKVVILDVTGVPAVDTGVVNHLMQAAQAARLMGAATLISGLSPANAQTLARLDVDLDTLNTAGSLPDAMETADRLLAPQRARA